MTDLIDFDRFNRKLAEYVHKVLHFGFLTLYFVLSGYTYKPRRHPNNIG